MCSHDLKQTAGFDMEDGCFRCSECGQLITKPPKWLMEQEAEKNGRVDQANTKQIESGRQWDGNQLKGKMNFPPR